MDELKKTEPERMQDCIRHLSFLNRKGILRKMWATAPKPSDEARPELNWQNTFAIQFDLPLYRVDQLVKLVMDK